VGQAPEGYAEATARGDLAKAIVVSNLTTRARHAPMTGFDPTGAGTKIDMVTPCVRAVCRLGGSVPKTAKNPKNRQRGEIPVKVFNGFVRGSSVDAAAEQCMAKCLEPGMTVGGKQVTHQCLGIRLEAKEISRHSEHQWHRCKLYFPPAVLDTAGDSHDVDATFTVADQFKFEDASADRGFVIEPRKTGDWIEASCGTRAPPYFVDALNPSDTIWSSGYQVKASDAEKDGLLGLVRQTDADAGQKVEVYAAPGQYENRVPQNKSLHWCKLQCQSDRWHRYQAECMGVSYLDGKEPAKDKCLLHMLRPKDDPGNWNEIAEPAPTSTADWNPNPAKLQAVPETDTAEKPDLKDKLSAYLHFRRFPNAQGLAGLEVDGEDGHELMEEKKDAAVLWEFKTGESNPPLTKGLCFRKCVAVDHCAGVVFEPKRGYPSEPDAGALTKGTCSIWIENPYGAGSYVNKHYGKQNIMPRNQCQVVKYADYKKRFDAVTDVAEKKRSFNFFVPDRTGPWAQMDAAGMKKFLRERSAAGLASSDPAVQAKADAEANGILKLKPKPNSGDEEIMTLGQCQKRCTDLVGCKGVEFAKTEGGSEELPTGKCRLWVSFHGKADKMTKHYDAAMTHGKREYADGVPEDLGGAQLFARTRRCHFDPAPQSIARTASVRRGESNYSPPIQTYKLIKQNDMPSVPITLGICKDTCNPSAGCIGVSVKKSHFDANRTDDDNTDCWLHYAERNPGDYDGTAPAPQGIAANVRAKLEAAWAAMKVPQPPPTFTTVQLQKNRPNFDQLATFLCL